ncbi:DUF6114 domain-containing protein [Streptomyces sp. NBC_00572]|uniref:DUF6114 domain-containing protein n=1 Tax=Streptomyces sp. NBC_00572 TaxID=2903664 RepID=UPI00224CD682|nr:DUF6114 domain-containing protein [Streptomyces sp. NBC_00572]MCX4986986.1 DUF6114 domain-containing protein [Streptomyces sp. NBC_00572]
MTTDPPPEPTPGPEELVPPASDLPAADPAARTRGARAAFRRWRRTRPFWATVWTALGGFVIFFLPMAPLGKILQVGVGGIAGMAGGVVLMAMALLMLLLPSQRHTAGVIAVIAGVASFPLSNLGGLFVGMVLSVLGGSMAFAWLPEKPAKRHGGLLRRTRPGAGTSVTPVPPVSVGSGTV